jgi:hypothetical protein
MFSSLFLVCFAFGSPNPPAEPAYFQINVDAHTPYSLFLNGEPLEANTRYKTEPLTELACVEVEIRYVSGYEVVKRMFFIDLKPGRFCSYTITLSARPSYVWC